MSANSSPSSIRSKWLFPSLLVGGIGLIALLLFSNTFSSEDGLPDQVDFNFHVKPILSDNCFACHGPDANKREAGLRLDIPEGAFATLKEQPNAHALVPGNLSQSVAIQRILSKDTMDVMPPPESHLSLTTREIDILKKWVEQGAEYKKHWAFLAPEPQEVPRNNSTWAKNEIDLFVANTLKENGLHPNEEADKERLLKRLSWDLTGLPPSIELQKQFLSDDSPEAYEKVVDQLLASPHYGEKMALHWLDVARYADSHGYQDDGLRTMWPWRDWVIHAFNENYSYKQFVTWQLAGDLLPNPTKEMLLATGFNRNHKITQEGGVIDEEYRVEYVTDRTNTFGKAFLAITLECAKCHDHKYDPVSQKDYFSTFAFFNQVPEKGLFGTIDASFADPPNMAISDKEVEESLNFINKQDTTDVMVMVMKDSIGMRTTHILDRGMYDAPAEQVGFALPASILPFDTTVYEQNRLGLANWLFDSQNPLTARVYVNRIWQEIFGRGLVGTSGDFGVQGDLPTNIALLDYLATIFQEKDWDIKYLVKEIVMSATYRQSSEISLNKLKKDPENMYLSWYPRKRLAAELVRDHVLASSGLLNPEIGGPSVKPYQPDGLWNAATSGRGLLTTYIPDKGKDLFRRGMYTFIKRTVPPPSMLTFDASNRDQCEVRRVETNTPLQALIMLNDPHVLEASRVLAESYSSEENWNPEEAIGQAFRRILCRKIRTEESETLLAYYQQEKEGFSSNLESAQSFLEVGESPRQAVENPAAVAALMQVIHTMYNMDETITKT